MVEGAKLPSLQVFYSQQRREYPSFSGLCSSSESSNHWLVKLKQAEQLTPKHHVRYFKERRVRAHPTTPSLPLWSDPPVSSIPRVQTIPATSPYNCLASLFNILAFQLRLTTCSFFSLLLFTPCSTTPLPNHTATHACVFKQLCPTQHSKRQTQQ